MQSSIPVNPHQYMGSNKAFTFLVCGHRPGQHVDPDMAFLLKPDIIKYPPGEIQ